jgi:hypothetical protein
MAGFIFGAGTPYTHEQLQRQRAIAERLAEVTSAGGPANTLPEGLMDLGTGIVSGLMKREADRTERAGRSDYNSRFNSITKSLLSGGKKKSGSSASSANMSGDIASGIQATAANLGIDPVDLATAISYETAGTFDPMKRGPTTKWGQHKGLIQFGEPQAAKYGVDWNNPVGSQLGPDGAVARYLRDTGVKPGMGLLDIYSAINAGGVGRYNRSDAHAGGAPGTVADKVRNQMAGHRAKAMAMFGGGASPAMAAAPMAAPQPDGTQIMPVSAPMAPQAAPMQQQGPMSAFQRSEMARLNDEVGVPTQQRQARQAAIMGQGSIQPASSPASAGGFFSNLLPQGSPPEQVAQVQQVESNLETMPIEQIAEMANSPYAEPWQQNLMQKYLEHRMEQQFAPPPDPMEQRRKQLELQKLEQDVAPKPMGRPMTAAEKEAFGLSPDAPGFINPDGTPELLDVNKINPQPDPTSNMRELAQINQERVAKGQQPIGLEEFIQSRRSGGITVGPDGTVQIGGPPGKLTEQQSKDVGFYNRASQVTPLLDSMDTALVDPLSAVGSSVPGVGNFLQSDAYRQATQAANEFLLALLRKDTGAAVTQPEMILYGGTYLPRAGDDEATIQQKRAARARATEGIRMGLGPAEILFKEREAQKRGAQPGTQPAPQQSASPPGGQQFTPEQIAAAKSRWGVATDAEAIQKLQQNNAPVRKWTPEGGLQ